MAEIEVKLLEELSSIHYTTRHAEPIPYIDVLLYYYVIPQSGINFTLWSSWLEISHLTIH